MLVDRSNSEDDPVGRAIELNWPDEAPASVNYRARAEVLGSLREELGADRFDLYFNLRKPLTKLEEWARDHFQGTLTQQEYKQRFDEYASRAFDSEMLEAFYAENQRLLEHYSNALTTISMIANNQREPGCWEELEPKVTREIEALSGKLALPSNNLRTVHDFLDEMRIENELGMLQVGEFQAMTAHWLASRVFDRLEKAWTSCTEIAERSRTDARYLYATTAADLFMSQWFNQFPAPQLLHEYLREEYVRARLIIRKTKASSSSESSIVNQTIQSKTPTVFVSYSWDSSEHKSWTRDFATRLRSDGVDATLDQWQAIPGDQLPQFMETAIRDNDYVLIICTPKYKARSDFRKGGVGYEGDIMTAELLAKRDHRKFIPVLRNGDFSISLPSWLQGKYGIDLRGETYCEVQYSDLLMTLHNQRDNSPPLGKPPLFKGRKKVPTSANEILEPIRIEGIVIDEVGEPRNDGTRGSALYAVPFKLSRSAPAEWAELFVQNWRSPPRYTTSHRPKSIRVDGDRVILTQTTLDEVRDVHRETLKLVLEVVNEKFAEVVQRRKAAEAAEELRQRQHREAVERLAGDISFD